MLVAERVVTHDFATLRFVLLNLVETNHAWTEAALYAEAVDDLFNYAACPSDFDILVAHWAIFVKD
jgi:hypothetical protein